MECFINSSDHELLTGIYAGSGEAYRYAFERYWDRVYAAALLLSKSPEIAEDITQDVFTMLWEKRDTLHAVNNLPGFLFISARNLIYSKLRKLHSQATYLEYQEQYFRESTRIEGAEEIYSRDLLQHLQQAILKLPPQQQKAFRLSRLEGLGHDEIATVMGISKVTVKSYIVQSLATLRKWLPGYFVTLLFLLCS
ncbi:RNA polymerase sigma-70 factor [Chitinophaga sp. sic0106]|uniref:RNA polymerase sigma-70 factor n=1 Tax=Chitinophaga sp. sic0106 TaxID=2854785 RepID=UPI001C447580|nr:RNA polymerase sigma-70 factor [Chitinophaga sp. sic0106]MBV7529766.1 RNA polymerase sigma-70 factor [Chitinophaga sp. sic0106]